MNGIADLYGGIDMTRVMFGEAARQAPMHMYVQGADGEGTVSFVGASRLPAGPHPLRYGSSRTHQLVIGQIIVMPRAVISTDALRGTGLAGLIRSVPTSEQLMSAGELTYAAPGYYDDLTARRAKGS